VRASACVRELHSRTVADDAVCSLVPVDQNRLPDAVRPKLLLPYVPCCGSFDAFRGDAPFIERAAEPGAIGPPLRRGEACCCTKS
jgi:hypothetical protein